MLALILDSNELVVDAQMREAEEIWRSEAATRVQLPKSPVLNTLAFLSASLYYYQVSTGPYPFPMRFSIGLNPDQPRGSAAF